MKNSKSFVMKKVSKGTPLRKNAWIMTFSCEEERKMFSVVHGYWVRPSPGPGPYLPEVNAYYLLFRNKRFVLDEIV